jgi:hypothetical protein
MNGGGLKDLQAGNTAGFWTVLATHLMIERSLSAEGAVSIRIVPDLARIMEQRVAARCEMRFEGRLPLHSDSRDSDYAVWCADDRCYDCLLRENRPDMVSRNFGTL